MSEQKNLQETHLRLVQTKQRSKVVQFHRCIFLTWMMLVVLVGDTSKVVAQVYTQGKPALPGEACKKAGILEKWTTQERWVWKQVCENEVANLVEKYPADDEAPDDWDDWPEARVLRPQFLETILLHEPYNSAVGRSGVRINGAWFKEPINLSNADLKHQIWLDDSRLNDVDFTGLKSVSHITMIGTEVNGNVDLRGAKVAGRVDMSDSKFTGKLIMYSLEIGDNLFMRNAEFLKAVDLRGAKIEGGLAMSGSKFAKPITLLFAQVGSNLDLSGGKKHSIDLTGATIKGELRIVSAPICDLP